MSNVHAYMTDDIRKFEEKIIGPFSKKQIICIAIGAVYSVPIGMLVASNDIGNKIFIILLLMSPALMVGWLKFQGAPAEMFFLRYLYWAFLTPKKRKYTSKTWFREIYERDEKIKKSSNGSNKKVKIKYSKNPRYKVYK